jgi:hypothetical protein
VVLFYKSVYLILCSSPYGKKKPYNNINIWRYRHKGGDISASTWRQAYSYAVARRAGEAEKAEYDPRARSRIITSFVPRYAKLYIVYIQGWWVGKQKPYGSKMEKFDVVGRSRGARNLPINIFIYLIFARHQKKKKPYHNINI